MRKRTGSSEVMTYLEFVEKGVGGWGFFPRVFTFNFVSVPKD
jgi:hypothetical protein